MANVSLKHIYKVYPNGTKAVNDFTMEIEDKSFIVFVGPSGCGKSTTLRMIAGLEEISAGELKIGGEVMNDAEPKDRDIAMVFQNYALYPHMTIYENIAFGLQMRKVPKDEIDRRVKEVAKTLGIYEYLKKKPKEMSGGQRQRVALGRAIVREPKVMLLDEPLSNLDAKLRTQMRSEIVKLHKKLNTTFIYVTHDQVEAMTMGTHIVVMKDGFIQQIDSPKNLYLYPENKFVAGFIGTPQMNFFEGVLDHDEKGTYVTIRNTELKIYLPQEHLLRLIPKYRKNEHEIYLGIRSENIVLEKKRKENFLNQLPFKISHVEDLGTETLVYGNLDLDHDDTMDEANKIIIKAKAFLEFEPGQIAYAVFDPQSLHLFDKETEKNMIPRMPELNEYPVVIQNKSAHFLNIELPLKNLVDDIQGQGNIQIPVSAVRLNGPFSAALKKCSKIGNEYLLLLERDGNYLFALSKEEVHEENVSFDIDDKQITIFMDEKKVVSALPEYNEFIGGFTMRKVSKKETNYYFSFETAEFLANEEQRQKMLKAYTGRKVFRTQFKYLIRPMDICLSSSGISAKVIKKINYRYETILKCEVNGHMVYAYGNAEIGEQVYLSINISHILAIEEERDIQII